jgi:hypothetical protein
MKNTDLIDRYLQAVKFWLPRSNKRDIVQELSEDLRSGIEEREKLLGYELNEEEVAGFLKRRGRPIVVASRYFPQQHLIGPVLFPIYSFVLKMVGLCYFLPWVLVWTGLMMFDRQYRAAHAGIRLVGDWTTFWQGVMFAFAAITIVFAVLERVQAAKSHLFDDWDPRNLPKLRQRRTTSSRTRNFIELFFNAYFAVWWLAVGYYPHTFFGFASDLFRPAPALGAYYWPIWGLVLINLTQQITNAFRPQWNWLRPATLLLTNTIMAAMLGFMLRIQPLVVLQPQYSQVDRYARASPIVNIAAYWVLVGIAVATLIQCCVYGYQLLQHLRSKHRPPETPVAVPTL